MATPAKAQINAKAESLEHVYQKLHELLSRYAPPFKTASGEIRAKKDLHLKIPKAVSIPGSYGGKPVNVAMASIILQKGYVGFYYMPVYMNSALKKKLSPSLTKLLKGKTCFHIKKLDAELIAAIESALDLGVKAFEERGWL
jgi:hypothetical protein